MVEAHAAGADGIQGPDKREEPETDILEGGENLARAEVGFRSLGGVAWEAGLEESFFFLGEPRCGGGEVREKEPDGDAEKDGYEAFEEEEPLPS